MAAGERSLIAAGRRGRPPRPRPWWAMAAAPVLLASGVAAHWLPPEALIARIEEPANRQRFGITRVWRDPSLPRLLFVRVGPQWEDVPAAERREATEQWLHLWRGSVAQGIVAVLDDATGRSVVNFDARGRAQLTDPAVARSAAVTPPAEGR